MKPCLCLLVLACFLAACTELFEPTPKSGTGGYYAVDAILTDRPDRLQEIVLTHSVPYFSLEYQPMVQGAHVQVNDVVFQETDPGIYDAPPGFCCESGKMYRLSIRFPDGRTCTAVSKMPENGFDVEAIDYAYSGGQQMDMDNVWTIGLWGRDKGMVNYYMMIHAVNGLYAPIRFAQTTINLAFQGQVIAGYTIDVLTQTQDLQEEYGDVYKKLETGDVITLDVLTIDKGYYDFLMSLQMNSLSIPLFSPQPADAPTNLQGEKVVGYFATCPLSTASVTIEDPQRSYYKKLFPFK